MFFICFYSERRNHKKRGGSQAHLVNIARLSFRINSTSIILNWI